MDGGGEIVHEDRNWIGHVNSSPTQPHLLSFCHEGPWIQVNHRIWGMDHTTGKVWKIRPQASGERIGHEYWFEDGEHIGYHGSIQGTPVFGVVRYDNSSLVEAPFLFGSNHFHSRDLSLIVGDGHRGGGDISHNCILLWRYINDAFEGPRVLCKHRSSFHIQQTHEHPRISPDGQHVLYTSDCSGYGNLYLARLKAFEDLPTAEELQKISTAK